MPPNMLQEERIREARARALEYTLGPASRPKVFASAHTLGQVYGVGIGLWFKALSWLRVLVLWMAVASVPFLVVIFTARFAPAPALESAIAPEGVTAFGDGKSFFGLTLAGVVDDAKDNATLPWMQIQLAGSDAVHSMRKTTFLMWTAVVDCTATAVFIIVALFLNSYSQAVFCKQVDENTVEAADFTVIVRGLPDVSPVDIGAHFSRFGDVMDVVVCKYFVPVLQLAQHATNLEEARRDAKSRAAQHSAAAHKKQLADAEVRMKKFFYDAEEHKPLPLKAAFVTFNTQQERLACLQACPRRWRSMWWQQRRHSDRLLGQHRFWVEEATSPEDCLYENLCIGRTQRYLRTAAVRAVVLVVLIVCALVVTKLMAVNYTYQNTITWLEGTLGGDVAAAMARAQRVGEPVAEYCAVQLAGVCQAQLSTYIESNVTLTYGSMVQWNSLPDQFVKSKRLFTFLGTCARQHGGCTLSACLPCYCSGLRGAHEAYSPFADQVAHVKAQCAAYVEVYDVKTMAIKSTISVVIVCLNLVLKAVLQLLVGFEKHRTKSEAERAYAILAFVSQLLNSVLVLLLVNAKFDQAKQTINSALLSNAQRMWFQNLVLSGSYPDFTTSWYEDVGASIIIIAALNVVLLPVFYLLTVLLRKLWQTTLVACWPDASQDAYNAAWQGEELALDYRVSDAMLLVTLVLMFGSGMPVLYFIGVAYLLTLELCDRHMLARVCKTPVRYGPKLPQLLLALLPWAGLAHSMFGLWMHTYFRTKLTQLHQLLGGAADVDGASPSTWLSARDLGDLSATSVWARITQANGLPLLVLACVGVLVIIIMRAVLLGCLGGIIENLCGCKLVACVPSEPVVDRRITYAAAISGPDTLLKGAPTYRLPLHPRYRDMFSNDMFLPGWIRMFGRTTFTRLRAVKGGRFEVLPQPMTELDTLQLVEAVRRLPPDIMDVACKLAGVSISTCGAAPPVTKASVASTHEEVTDGGRTNARQPGWLGSNAERVGSGAGAWDHSGKLVTVPGRVPTTDGTAMVTLVRLPQPSVLAPSPLSFSSPDGLPVQQLMGSYSAMTPPGLASIATRLPAVLGNARFTAASPLLAAGYDAAPSSPALMVVASSGASALMPTDGGTAQAPANEDAPLLVVQQLPDGTMVQRHSWTPVPMAALMQSEGIAPHAASPSSPVGAPALSAAEPNAGWVTGNECSMGFAAAAHSGMQPAPSSPLSGMRSSQQDGLRPQTPPPPPGWALPSATGSTTPLADQLTGACIAAGSESPHPQPTPVPTAGWELPTVFPFAEPHNPGAVAMQHAASQQVPAAHAPAYPSVRAALQPQGWTAQQLTGPRPSSAVPILAAEWLHATGSSVASQQGSGAARASTSGGSDVGGVGKQESSSESDDGEGMAGKASKRKRKKKKGKQRR